MIYGNRCRSSLAAIAGRPVTKKAIISNQGMQAIVRLPTNSTASLKPYVFMKDQSVSPVPVDAQVLFSRLQRDNAEIATRGGVELRVPPTAATVTSDATLLESVLRNLAPKRLRTGRLPAACLAISHRGARYRRRKSRPRCGCGQCQVANFSAAFPDSHRRQTSWYIRECSIG
jgi:hypothetical protein